MDPIQLALQVLSDHPTYTTVVVLGSMLIGALLGFGLSEIKRHKEPIP